MNEETHLMIKKNLSIILVLNKENVLAVSTTRSGNE